MDSSAQPGAGGAGGAGAGAEAAPMRVLLQERGLLLGYLNAIVRDLHVAEDLLQEALMLAMRQRFEHADHARGWIRLTARNLAMNELRRRQRRHTALSDAVLDALEPNWDEEAASARTQRLAELRACYGKLSANARQLIDLRFGRGLDGAAVAREVGRPLNTVYVSLSRIYRRLAACMGAPLEGS
jgi:RNA polymerase sigma-70 factor (ECF subfamily)